MPHFDQILQKETNFKFTLHQLTHQNIGWFVAQDIGDPHLINEWGIKRSEGLYLLWWKEDYCDEHDRFHMTCRYVGKGKVVRRLIAHWGEKDFDEEMLIYFTYTPMLNRQAKYVEQLLLDIYNIPLNHSENKGQHKLCAHFTQEEVD